MKRGNKGTEGQPPGGDGGATRTPSSADALAELATLLQAHSESLRRDICRLQRALSEINGAMALSLERADRIRLNTDRLRSIVRSSKPSTGGEPRWPRERRSGMDRRSGNDRRRDAREISGLLRWIEGTSLDRRSGVDRRSATADRRGGAAAAAAPKRPPDAAATPKPAAPAGTDATADPADCGRVVSLAAYRRAKRLAGSKS
ncbi:MAG: hypothetical protein EA406_01205 [Rhodospirillales bacterium]|nr:MAG: hypothetical protein EA406_01205 [Rhodospirillales bacterium]